MIALGSGAGFVWNRGIGCGGGFGGGLRDDDDEEDKTGKFRYLWY